MSHERKTRTSKRSPLNVVEKEEGKSPFVDLTAFGDTGLPIIRGARLLRGALSEISHSETSHSETSHKANCLSLRAQTADQ